MKKIFYHRIENFNGLDTIKGIEGYCKRALTVAEPGDFVLLDWYEDIIFPPPELKFLNEAGIGSLPEDTYVVRFDSEKSWRENYLVNRNIIEELRAKLPEKLAPFSGKSHIVFELAQELGISVASAPFDLAEWGEDTATLLEIGEEGTVPRGFTCNTNEEALEKWRDLKSLSNFTGLGVIKNRHSASGLLSAIVRNEDDVKKFLDSVDMSELGGATVEEWYENDIRSPSINYFIKHTGEIRELFISDQIFEKLEPEYGKEGTRIHAGNVSPSSYSKEVQEKIRRVTMSLVEKLKANGYWGPVGFDTIVLEDGKVIVAEINSRVTGPHYGWRPAQKFGADMFRMRNEEDLKPENVEIEKVSEVIRNADLMPIKETQKGYVVYNFHPGKKFTGVAFACNGEDFEDITLRVDQALEELK